MQKKIIHIKPQSKSKLASLDILKGIAIIMIIIVHNRHFLMKNMDGLRQLINFGQMGCQIFFLVSGTALCYSWTSQLKKSKEKNIFAQYITFIKNRYLRLAPGFLIILFINLLLNIILMDICKYSPGYVMSRSVKGILLNVFFLHGLSKEFINEVFPGGWYIGTAFILYIIFPFLFSICKLLYERFKALVLMIPFALLIFDRIFNGIVSSKTSFELYPDNNSFMYYLFTNHLPGFCLGIVMYFIISSPKFDTLFCNLAVRLLTTFFAILTGLFSVKMYLTNISVNKHNYAFVYIPFIFSLCIFFAALVMISLERSNKLKINNKSNLFNLIISFISDCGKKSYGMYLTHSFVSWYGIKAVITEINKLNYDYNDLLLYILFLIPSILIIYVMGTYMELFLNKIRKS